LSHIFVLYCFVFFAGFEPVGGSQTSREPKPSSSSESTSTKQHVEVKVEAGQQQQVPDSGPPVEPDKPLLKKVSVEVIQIFWLICSTLG
jgi:hypothetical protein